MKSPVLLVIAGPNGAGKTTITARLQQEHWSDGVEYLNPDDVARDRFGDWNSPEASLQAARWTADRREALLARGEGIAFETVFSAPDEVDFLARAKAKGYFVRFFFIGTSDPTINAARVAARVMAGGHTVPIDKIISRYVRSFANLSSALDLADRVYLYDNSIDGVEARLCARAFEGQLRKVYGPLPTWVADATDPLPPSGFRRPPRGVMAHRRAPGGSATRRSRIRARRVASRARRDRSGGGRRARRREA